ncbi:MAG: DUF4280 domain-containing protein [Anaerolineales bacterium]|nr:DUF4280 domain-containing protein [Anaerolineales bacterium]MCB8959315.1 DUF4280 domain-containing protein [Ardenticatenales bacterium]
MAQQVCNGAMLQCTFGVAPSTMIVIPKAMVNTSKQPAATIMDNVPIANIPPFGMCSAPTNPAVIAATSAAAGVFTPAPCIPVTTAPWAPGCPTVTLGKIPALNSTSKLMCTWLGVISVTQPGQFTHNIP